MGWAGLQRVDVFDYEMGSGAISNRRTGCSFPDCEEIDTTGEEKERDLPDGMCLDSSGKLWVAIGESGTVRQMDVETGKDVSRVEVPVKRVTSCAFGGEGRERRGTTRGERVAAVGVDVVDVVVGVSCCCREGFE